MSKIPPKQKGDPETTGHVWDGIQEFNNPLPRWWVWIFYLTIIWGVGYTIAYPAWPGIKGATAGLLGWSTRANVAAEIAAAEDAHAAINADLTAAPLETAAADPRLNGYAVSKGAAVFRTWCAQCHGSGAAGAVGYPNLLDDDWLWGGTLEDIYLTIRHGVRNDTDPDARFSQMPAFGQEGLLEPEQIEEVVNYVMTLSGVEPPAPVLVAAGREVFADNCAACHGEAGEGDPTQGAPNLADQIWLHGGDYAALMTTVNQGRGNAMPGWTGRLTEADIRAVSIYVHQLGGGE